MDPPLLDHAVAPGEPGGADSVGILKQGVVQGIQHIEVGSEHSIFPEEHAFLVEPLAPAIPEGRVFEEQRVLDCGDARGHVPDGVIDGDVVGGEGGLGGVVVGDGSEGKVVVGVRLAEGGRGEEGAANGGGEGVEVVMGRRVESENRRV